MLKMLEHITPVILTYNEAPNIGRVLQRLGWAGRIVLVDSGSTDTTLEIARLYSQVDIFHRPFDTHTLQWNYGLAQVATTWVLSLDADYILSATLVDELANLSPSDQINSYYATFQYCVFGKPLRGTILPPRQLLFRRDRSTYLDDGHTQRLRTDGLSGRLTSVVLHDDRKPLSRWIWAQERYMLIEAEKILKTSEADLSLADRLRKRKAIAPFIVLLYCLFLRGGILDGWRGWYYAFQRMFAEVLLSLRLIEMSRQQTLSSSREQPKRQNPTAELSV